jgi:hypothetical protein
MRCVQDGPKVLRVFRLRGNQDSINLFGGSKIKFIIHFIPTKASAFPIQKTEQLAKLMTTKLRRHVKPGSTIFDSEGEIVSMIAAAFSRTACEFDTKTTTDFPSGRILRYRNGTR